MTERVEWTQERFGMEVHLTVAEAARTAGVSTRDIMGLVASRAIAYQTLYRPASKRHMIPVSEVERIGRVAREVRADLAAGRVAK